MPRRDRPQDNETLLLLLIALIAPPIAVFMMRGCGHEVVICVVLGFLLLVFLSPCSCSLHLTDPFLCDQSLSWTHICLFSCRRAFQEEQDWPGCRCRNSCSAYQVQCCPRSECFSHEHSGIWVLASDSHILCTPSCRSGHRVQASVSRTSTTHACLANTSCSCSRTHARTCACSH